RETMQQLIAAQPLLGAIANDASLRGIMTSLSTALLGVQHGQTELAKLEPSIAALNTSLRGVLDGKLLPIAWRQLVTGGKGDAKETRRFIVVHPNLEYSDLQPGAAASQTIRTQAKALGLVPERGVRIRLTGMVPMADDEFASLAQGTGLMGALMMGGV